MFLVLFAAVVLFFFSPFMSLVFFTGFGGKYLGNTKDRTILLSSLGVLTFFFVVFKTLPIFYSLNLFFGLGISSIVFFEISDRKDFYYGISVLGVINSLFIFIRDLFLKKNIENSLKESLVEVGKLNNLLSERLNFSPEQSLEFSSMIENVTRIYLDYQMAIWTLTVVIAFYIGVLIYSKKNKIILNHQFIRVPDFLVFFLIADLLLLLVLKEKKVLLNILIILLSVYMIDGIAVTDYFWRSYFARRKFLFGLLIVIMLINPYFLLLLSLIGVFDYWFNFRKIGLTEEK